jgi:hypothetical protein
MVPIRFPSETTPWRVYIPARFSSDHKRKSKYFETKAKALSFCAEYHRHGPGVITGYVAPKTKSEQDQDTALFNGLLAKVGGDRTRLHEAFDYFEKRKLNVKAATVREAVEAFQAWRSGEVKAGRLKASTVETDRWRVNKLIEKFDVVQLADLTPVALREFFDGIKGKRRSIYKSLSVFFGWARKRKFIAENPLADFDVGTEIGRFGVNKAYYQPDTFRRMLRIAAGLESIKPAEEPTRDFIDLLPWFILSGFLGLRSCEAYRTTSLSDAIKWTDLHFDAEPRPNVEVREEVAKQTAKDSDLHHIETTHYLEAAKAWLSLVPHYEGNPYIVRWTKRNIADLKAAFTKATGIKFLKNGFRKSFATYALAYGGLAGVGRLAIEMGNSEAIAKSHYVKNIAPGSGKAWFNLRPFELVSSVPVAAA